MSLDISNAKVVLEYDYNFYNTNGTDDVSDDLIERKKKVNSIPLGGVTYNLYEHTGFNQIINEEVEASNDNIHSEKIYLNGTKFVSKLKLFSDDNSISSDLREFKARDVLINEANLVLHLDNNIHKSNYEFLPKRLYVYSYKDGLPIEDYNKDFSINFSATAVNANKFLFGGILQYDSNNLPTSYKFNITNHISNIVRYIKLILNIKKFDIENITYSSFIPFLKAKVKIKNEVVPMDYNFSFKNKITKNYLSPKKWDNLLSQKNVKIVDARKPFEYEVGTFRGAINPNTYNFREFKTYLTTLDKKQKIGMFCTGGIRCEKASNYLLNNGFKNVYMLKGGIINYFNKTDPKKSNWKGECFVFDNRVTIKKNTKVGNYGICNACRLPISKKDKKSKYYKIGLSCPKCYDKLTSSQITRFTVRHKQLLNKKIPLIYKRK